MPSFDIVSELNLQEVDNAINQAIKEVSGRYDFKGAKAEYLWDKKEVTILADDDYKLNAMRDILQTRLLRRGVDIKCLKYSEIEPAGGKMLRMKVSFLQGIDREFAKKIIAFIKDTKLKVQPQVVDDKLRVTSKSIDELQETMGRVRTQSFDLPLQFNNMR